MKLLLHLSLVGLGHSLDAACLQGEFFADGYTTGQNIELDYDNTEITRTTVDGPTQLTIAFLVPKLYTEQYDASAYAITFNRLHTNADSTTYEDIGEELNAWKNQVVTTTDQDATGNQYACFTNRAANNTFCDAVTPGVWSAPTDDPENACVSNVAATVPWTEGMTNGAFGEVDIKDDGKVTEVFLTATVETWRKFDERSVNKHQGQMTGNVQIDEDHSPTDRTGTYFGDGGDLDVDFGTLEINDWRYTLYQIPFILRFPKTVIVETPFTVGSAVTLLHGVVEQDVVTVNLNPDDANTEDTFAVLDVTVTTQVQYPYGIRSPDDAEAAMTVVVGGTVAGGGTHARQIDFMHFDHESSCGGVTEGEMCSQDWKMRIIPGDDDPCSVAGDYTMEMWAECVGGHNNYARGGPDGCSLDDEVEMDDLDMQRDSNGYFTLTFNIAHQSFCPEIMDTVHVVSDFKAYHTETREDSERVQNSGDEKRVFTNDIIYYEATYRTASEMSGQTITNNDDGDGNDNIIDYIRPVKVFTDVTIGVSADGTASDWVSGDDWKDNLNWSPLGGSRVAGDDFTDDSTTFDGTSVLTVTHNGPDKISYNIILCQVPYITADYPQRSNVKATDCFTAITDTARLYFDFNPVTPWEFEGNTVDENEVVFKVRLDERVVPVGPKTDESFVKMTIEAEVYYEGNRHPTRRLLQVDPAAPTNKQMNVQSLTHSVLYRPPAFDMCLVDPMLTSAEVTLVLDYSNLVAPELRTVSDWSINFGSIVESHLDLRRSIEVINVQSCTKTGCAVLLMKRPAQQASTRRLEKGATKEIHVTLKVKSTVATKAGIILNQMQTQIKSGYLFFEAPVSKMVSPDCDVQAIPDFGNDHLASTASSTLAPLFAIFVALVASL